MTSAHHDTAVQLLTDHQRFVRLVVQREIKGPLEPPQSPHSPSLLKGLSPSGYMANRPGYKRSIGGSSGDSPIADNNPDSKYIITNTSPVVPQQYYSQQSPKTPVSANIPKTNGIENNGNLPQPVPAPRRLTSQSSIGSGVNGGGAHSQNGNQTEDEEAQVRNTKVDFLNIYFYY